MGIVLGVGVSHALISVIVLLGISGELHAFEAHDEFLIHLTSILGFPVFQPARFLGIHVVESLGGLSPIAFVLNSLLWGIAGSLVIRRFGGRLARWARSLHWEWS